MSVKWMPFKPCQDPDARTIFDAIRDRDFGVLKDYAQKGFDWEILPFEIKKINSLYDSYHFRKNLNDLQFNSLIEEENINNSKKEWSDYLDLVSENLFDSCQEPKNVCFVKKYIESGYDFHRYDSIYLYLAVAAKHLDIAELLCESGAKPSQWPEILRHVMSAADTEFWFEYPVDKDFPYDLDRIAFLLERGAEPNHMVNAPPTANTLKPPWI